MLEFLGTIFSYLVAIVIFGAMLATAIYGFLQAEKSVKRHESAKADRAPSMTGAPASQQL